MQTNLSILRGICSVLTKESFSRIPSNEALLLSQQGFSFVYISGDLLCSLKTINENQKNCPMGYLFKFCWRKMSMLFEN
jgi:hypothetical protein